MTWQQVAAEALARHRGEARHGERHSVEGTYWVGTVEVTAGVIDHAALEIFRQGQCHALALALHELAGWEIVAQINNECVLDPDCYDLTATMCSCQIIHLLARDSDGWVYDIAGQHDPEGFCDPDEDQSIVELDADVLATIVGERDHTWRTPALAVARAFARTLIGEYSS